jgi:hypothetical protein
VNVSGSETGRKAGRAGRRQHSLVRLVYRLVLAQAAAAAAVGLPFSRRHLPSILITVVLVVAVLLLAWVARAGTRGAWMALFAFECVFFSYGLSRFVIARYVGGTLSAAVIAGTLLHPAVARAFSVLPLRLAGDRGADVSLGDAPGEPFRGHSRG